MLPLSIALLYQSMEYNKGSQPLRDYHLNALYQNHMNFLEENP